MFGKGVTTPFDLRSKNQSIVDLPFAVVGSIERAHSGDGPATFFDQGEIREVLNAHLNFLVSTIFPQVVNHFIIGCAAHPCGARLELPEKFSQKLIEKLTEKLRRRERLSQSSLSLSLLPCLYSCCDQIAVL